MIFRLILDVCLFSITNFKIVNCSLVQRGKAPCGTHLRCETEPKAGFFCHAPEHAP